MLCVLLPVLSILPAIFDVIMTQFTAKAFRSDSASGPGSTKDSLSLHTEIVDREREFRPNEIQSLNFGNLNTT